MVANLTAISNDIQKNIRKFPAGNQRNMMNIIKKCIDKTIIDAKTNVIDADFVKTKYETDIETARGYYDKIEADPAQKGSFQENLAELNSDTLTWLATEFGLV